MLSSIKVDGQFEVLCRDKVGTFTAGAPGFPSDRPHNLAGAAAIVRHMAGLGWREVSCPPGLLDRSEMVVCRVG